MHDRVIKAIDSGRTHVDVKGAPIRDRAEKLTDPGSQPLTGIAGSNAAAGALPDSIGSKLLDKIPGTDIPTAVPGASVPEAQQKRMQQGSTQDPMMQTIRSLVPKVKQDKE